MRTSAVQRLINALTLLVWMLAATPAWARLPRPIQISGTAVFVDHDTQTLVFKADKGKKPLVLDWNEDTQFVQNGAVTNATALQTGTTVLIHYKDVSFKNPLLKKVLWEAKGENRQPLSNS